MANIDAPFGLRPIRYASGAPYNGACTPYSVPAADGTALFIGDPVVVTGDAHATQISAPGVGTFPVGTISDVIKSSATTGNITGVIVGVAADPTNLENKHRVASTERIVFVADDPDLVFLIQEDGDTTPLAATSIANNADLIFTHAGNTATGLSGVELDSSTVNTTSTLMLRILRLHNTEGNEIDATNGFGIWEVMINEHTYSAGIAGIA